MIDRKVLLGRMARLVDKSKPGTSDKGVSTRLIVLKGKVVTAESNLMVYR